MNKIFSFIIFIFWGTLLYAQDVVFDGVTFSADGKTLIKYPRDKVGEEYIVPEGTEIIGEKAFYDNSNLSKVTLPSSLKEIEDCAFLYTSICSIIWGNYPDKIGKDIFAGTTVKEFQLTNENTDCVLIGGVLFSSDGKKLFRCPSGRVPGDYVVPEGTEIINEYAFEWVNTWKVILPSTLKIIKEGAFWINEVAPTQNSSQEYEYRSLDELICNAIIPPTIIGNPFGMPENIKLYVPDSSFENYCNAVGWEEFKMINGQFVSINRTLRGSTIVLLDGSTLHIRSEQRIVKIELYNQSGTLLTEQGINGWFYHFDMNRLYQQGILLLKVVYDDKKEEVFKLCKNEKI